MDDEQLLRYSRHILLNEIGTEAQERFYNARAAIVGVGGLGSQVAHFLASAGVGSLVLCDCDTVELTNLQRQTLYTTADIGKRKVEVACLKLLTVNPEVRVKTIDQRLDDESLADIAANVDIIIDCSDNYKTRHAVNRAAHGAKIPHVSGAVIRFDGQVTVFDHRDPDAPCYHCVFGADEKLEEARCATLGVFAPLVGSVGCIEAGEALKLIGGFGETLAGKMLMINALTCERRIVKYQKNPHCPVCGE